MASIQFISGKICYNRKNYFKEVLMESTVFTNLRGSEGALTFNFFCESLITSLHTLTHVMEDAGLAVPDNVGDIADALGEMGSHLMEDYQRGALDLGRFKDEIIDFYALNFAVNDALASAIMSHDDLQYYYYVYMQGLYIFFPNMMEAFNADIDDAKIIPFLDELANEFRQLAGSGS